MNGKNWASSLFYAIIISSLAASVGATEYCLANRSSTTGQVCFPLITGQHYNSGTVCVWITAVDLRVQYTLGPDPVGAVCTIVEAHLWVGLNLEDVPMTPSGNPIPGQFPYAVRSLNQKTYTFVIPLTDIYGHDFDPTAPCNDYIFIAAHSVVSCFYSATNVTVTQTGWSQGGRFTDRGNWAMFSQIYVLCDEDCNNGGGGNATCDTAFARSPSASNCFLDLGMGFERWGWTNGPIMPGTYVFALYAGAAQCNIVTKGVLVGSVTVIYQTNTVAIQYSITVADFCIHETHAYAGSEILPKIKKGKNYVYTVAPGQYPGVHEELDCVTSDSYTFSGFYGQSIYVVAHAVVCGHYEH